MSQYADDRRLTSRVLAYWGRLAGVQGNMPLHGKFQSGAMADVWPQCMMISIQPAQGNHYTYKCDEMGRALIEVFGANLTGSPIGVSSGRVMLGKKFIKTSEVAIKRKEPCFDEGNFLNDKSEMVKYRRCFLPFVDANQKVTHLLVGMSWRVFA